MQFTQHYCPTCGHIEAAPFGGVAHGDAGIWCCESCKQAFYIWIHFRRVADTDLARASETTADDALLPEQHSGDDDHRERRVRDIVAELSRLRRRIHELEATLARLQDDPDN